MTVVALVAAAGRSERVGQGTAKQFRRLAGRPMISHTLGALAADARVAGIMVVLPADTALPQHALSLPVATCCGGATRADSVLAGLKAIATRFPDCEQVLVHDAARPCLHPHDLGAVIDAGLSDGQGAILARRVTETVKRGDERIETTVPRDGLWLAQTPQVFARGLLQSTLAAAGEVTDEAMAMEKAGYHPRLVAARYPNPKITWPEDFELAEQLLTYAENR